MVEVSLTVGKLDASLALMLTKDHHLIEFPTLLLPPDVKAGSIVKISCEQDSGEEKADKNTFEHIQSDILTSFGKSQPKPPALRVKNVTQTSVVLEWDPIDVATADLISLSLQKNGQRFGLIPNPLKRTATKLSGLSIDSDYHFQLILATTAGTFSSDVLTVKTHKMTDLSGITMCIGSLAGSEIDEAEISEIAAKIGAKPLQNTVKLDTTHFICTESGDSPQYSKAQDWNIPIVRPEWVRACESERRLVGVRAYYLNADPKLRPPVQQRERSRTMSQTTSASSVRPAEGPSKAQADGQGESPLSSQHNIPQLKVTEPVDGPLSEVADDAKSLDILPEEPAPESDSVGTETAANETASPERNGNGNGSNGNGAVDEPNGPEPAVPKVDVPDSEKQSGRQEPEQSELPVLKEPELAKVSDSEPEPSKPKPEPEATVEPAPVAKPVSQQVKEPESVVSSAPQDAPNADRKDTKDEPADTKQELNSAANGPATQDSGSPEPQSAPQSTPQSTPSEAATTTTSKAKKKNKNKKKNGKSANSASHPTPPPDQDELQEVAL